MKNIKSDYIIYKMNFIRLITGLFKLSPFYLLLLYRISNYLYNHKIKFLPGVFKALGVLIFNADIHYSANIGKGLNIPHSTGIVIGGGL